MNTVPGKNLPSPYRVALHGFSDFERLTLTFCLKHAAARRPAYVHVELIADSDFIVADASHEAISGSVTRGDRMKDTLFVGDHPPFGAGAHLRRPIDPERILRVLDELAMQRGPRAAAGRPDIVLPLDASDTAPQPFSASEAVDTTPAAFHHEPVSIRLHDPEHLDPLDTTPTPLDVTSKPGPQRRVAQAPSRLAGKAPPGVKAAAAPVPAAPAAATVAANASPPKAVPRPAASGPAPKGEAERAEAKAEARRRSRHARQMQAALAAAHAPRDVLVLDRAARFEGVGAVLESFGFVVHRVPSSASAVALLGHTPIVAAFIDAGADDPDGPDGLDLCQEIKHRLVRLESATPAVMLMAERESAAGRVRAKLAGCDALLTLPVARGDVARALEACNVALPADARRP